MTTADGERGGAALELALGVAVLLIPAALAVISFGPWLERQVFVRTAAAEAARSAVLAEGDPAAAGAATVVDLASGRGLNPGSVKVSMCGGPLTAAGSAAGTCRLERGVLVTAEVVANVPLITTPWGQVGGVDVSATHAEPVDAYRSLP